MKKISVFLIIVSLVLGCKQNNPVPATAIQKERIFPGINPKNYNVSFLIMYGTYNTEFTAPFDIFQHTKFRDGIKAMNTFTVANTLEPIVTFEGIRVLPDFDYTKDKLPPIDILVLPSAQHHMDTDLKDGKLIDFIKEIDKTALYVTSHCDGAFPLAKADILDSVTSTTFPSDIETYKKMFPNIKVSDNVLFVHDGKYITSAGGTKSFEAALWY